MICIATPDPDTPAETFVRQHIQKIAPGNTVVLYFQGRGESLDGVPNLRISANPAFHWAARQFSNLINTVLFAYPGAVSRAPARVVEQFLLKNQVQSLLAEFGTTGSALAPICRKLGIRLVVNFHGHDATVMPKRWIIRYAYHHLNTEADAFVCGSQHFADVLANLGFSKEKIYVVPCGIELDEFDARAEKDPNLVVAVGRFVEKKAPHLTIRAFMKVLEKFPDARLEMIGDGPLMPMCRELVEKEELDGKVILHGAKPHDFVKKLLSKAGVFVQHSVVAANGDTESQGISLLEAMASGVPVVSTRHNGFVETVEDGVTGFLVDEEDVEDMAERIMLILENQTLRNCMSAAGVQRVTQNYDSEKSAGQLRELLRL